MPTCKFEDRTGLNEKVLNGVAIYDLNNNGKDDIVVATENEKMVSII